MLLCIVMPVVGDGCLRFQNVCPVVSLLSYFHFLLTFALGLLPADLLLVCLGRSGGDLVLGPGEIHYDALLMQGGTTLTILGPATVVFDRFGMLSGAELIFDAQSGPIELHGTSDFVLESNTDMVTLSDSAVDVTIFLSGSNMTAGRRDRVQLSSNADFIGAIYAPNIFYRLESNFDVYGSIICGALDLYSNGEIHFDEALLYGGDGDSTDYLPTLWRVLPHQ